MLYRVAQNSWNEAPRYPDVLSPPKSFPQGTRPKFEDSTGEHAADTAKTEDVHVVGGGSEKTGQDEVDDYEGDGAIIPPLENTIMDPKANVNADADAGKKEFSSGKEDTSPGKPANAATEALDAAGAQVIVEEDETVRTKTPTKGETSPGKAANAEMEAVAAAGAQALVEEDDTIRSKNPTNEEPNLKIESEANNAPPKVHWHRVEENFPVDRMITLPSGTPKPIPKIQFDFGLEAESARITRTQRQKRVQLEMQRAWAGYKKYAWMHDELSPVSAKYRDPFCGWAATLVDSLDTLWIAGMKEEFDEAAKAVKDIDFTYTPRRDIPVFETTIRYLGGLVGAFDVSGGHDGQHKILLDKAIELAEILLGIFDTPNRMPLLYYQWRPEYASQPHRTGRVGIAELASLSLEFTRLAQITGESKYYDGVARITDALVEMQEAGTTIPGLFPESLDASGCNKTATTIRDALSAEAKKQMDSEELLKSPEGFVPSAEKVTVTTESKLLPVGSDDRLERRGEIVEEEDEGSAEIPTVPEVKPPAHAAPYTAAGATSQWDCVPQGLRAGGSYQTFHMGGGQDSAYEYFPKEYLLLGGLEPAYQKLHEDTVDAIDEWLLYRPMSDDGWDVLFPAKVGTSGSPEKDLTPTYEITHLTCFIGGMYGLGGKIFGREKDIETAKKLTDGCVWAYQLTPSGLMVEGAQVLPCPTLDKCDFNETLWHESLDGSREWRDAERVRWEKQEEQHALLQAEAKSTDSDEAAAELETPAARDATDESVLPESLKQKLNSTAADEELGTTKHHERRSPPVSQSTPKNQKPLTHDEYVSKRLDEEKLPPGFININSKQYILRYVYSFPTLHQTYHSYFTDFANK